MCQDDQEYITPPQVIGIMIDTVEAMNETVPNQSNFLALATHLPGMRSSFRKKKIATVPVPIMGILIQKIHRQDTFCANAPPIMGPATLPIAHIAPRYPNQASSVSVKSCERDM